MRRLVAATLLLLPSMPAQARKPAFGAVADARGMPAAGVAVTLVSTPWFGDEQGPTDVVAITTDAHGRFLAQLQPGCVYSAWAATGADRDGRFSASPVQENVLAGSQLALQLGRLRPRQRVQLRGGEAWAVAGALRLEAMPAARCVLRVPLIRGENGETIAPPLPPLQRVLVLDERGDVLWLAEVRRNADGELDTGDVPVELPTPRQVRVRVSNPVGQPIAGATVEHSVGELRSAWVADSWVTLPALRCWRRGAVTAADGTAALQVPAPLAAGGVASGVHLRVRAAGRAELHVGNVAYGQTFVGGKEHWTAAVSEVPIVLEPAPALELAGGGSREPLLFLTMATGDTIVGEALRPGARGSCLPVPAQLQRGSLLALLSRADGGPLYCAAESTEAGYRLDANARVVRLQVRDACRCPAQTALAVALPWDGTPPFTPLLPVPLDRGGRGEIALGGGDWLVFATAGDGLAWRSLRADDSHQDWQLDMRPMGLGTVRVLSAGGTPVAGARVSKVCVNMRGDFSWKGECGALAMMLQRLQPRLLEGRTADADGRIVCPVFPLECWSVGVSVDGSEFVDVVPGEVVDLFLQ